MNLSEMQTEAHENSRAHGFWEGGENTSVATKLMLIVTEVAEAMEEYRLRDSNIHTIRYRIDGKPEGFPSELADIIIRVGDLAEWAQINLDDVVEEKMAYNKGREHMHGKSL